MPSFDEILAELLEEPEQVLGVLADVVSRGRLQADDLDGEILDILSRHDLIVYLMSRTGGRGAVRTWVYPSPLGLKVFAILEREAEKAAPPPKPKTRRGRRTGAR